jgi:hypothetical protein
MLLSFRVVACAPVTTSTSAPNGYCLCGCEIWSYFQGIMLSINIFKQSVSENILDIKTDVDQLLHKQKLGDTDVSPSIIGSLNQGGNNAVGIKSDGKIKKMNL